MASIKTLTVWVGIIIHTEPRKSVISPKLYCYHYIIITMVLLKITGHKTSGAHSCTNGGRTRCVFNHATSRRKFVATWTVMITYNSCTVLLPFSVYDRLTKTIYHCTLFHYNHIYVYIISVKTQPEINFLWNKNITILILYYYNYFILLYYGCTNTIML